MPNAPTPPAPSEGEVIWIDSDPPMPPASRAVYDRLVDIAIAARTLASLAERRASDGFPVVARDLSNLREAYAALGSAIDRLATEVRADA